MSPINQGNIVKLSDFDEFKELKFEVEFEIIPIFNHPNYKKQVRLIHYSSDGVYPSIKGNYSVNSPLKSFYFYGWTKLHSEPIVKLIKYCVVIRTRFFDKTNIKYDTAATDIFTSAIEVQNLAREIKNIALT